MGFKLEGAVFHRLHNAARVATLAGRCHGGRITTCAWWCPQRALDQPQGSGSVRPGRNRAALLHAGGPPVCTPRLRHILGPSCPMHACAFCSQQFTVRWCTLLRQVTGPHTALTQRGHCRLIGRPLSRDCACSPARCRSGGCGCAAEVVMDGSQTYALPVARHHRASGSHST